MRSKILLFIFSHLLMLSFAQVSDTLLIDNPRLSIQTKNLYVPVGLLFAGGLCEVSDDNSIKQKIVKMRNRDFFGFENRIDDYAQFAPIVGIYGFEMLGMVPRTDWKNRTAIFMKGQFLNLGMVYILKNATKVTRPDGTALSFPSGHTANVFASATMLSIEYGENYTWVPYLSYGIATGVGVMRIANNKHYISDVLFGAGLGILSMKVAYWTHQYQWNQPKSQKDPFAGVIY